MPFCSHHAAICLRMLIFGFKILCSKGWPPLGDTLWPFIHSSMASRSYVKPSEAKTGSAMGALAKVVSHSSSAALNYSNTWASARTRARCNAPGGVGRVESGPSCAAGATGRELMVAMGGDRQGCGCF